MTESNWVFTPRRSTRRLINKDAEVEHAIQAKSQAGLVKIQNIPGKGRGIETTRTFKEGDFVVEYIGELIDKSEGLRRNEIYSKDDKIGSFLYYFGHKNKKYCIDTTQETVYYGRLINHSKNSPNLRSKVVEVAGTPHLIFLALRDIEKGTELLYNYQETDPDVVAENPWMNHS